MPLALCALRTVRSTLCVVAVAASSLTAGAADLPAADIVVAESIKALGGKEAIDAVKTAHIKLTVQTGMVMTIDSHWARDGRRLMMNGVGGMTIPMGFDGEVAWSRNPMSGEYQLVQVDQVMRMDRQANMHMRFLLFDEVQKNDLKSLKTVGITTFGERECYKLHFVRKGEQNEGHVYYDTETHLPVGMESIDPRNANSAGMMVFQDWKVIDGVKFFQKAIGRGGGREVNFVVDGLTLNDVDPSVFELPDEVKALAGKTTSRPAEGPKLSEFSPADQAEIKEMLRELARLDAAELANQIADLEGAVQFLPEDKRRPVEYVLIEAKKLLQKAGGVK